MKLNFRHLFVIMPVSVEFIFMHMQNTYEDYMTKIQQLSILYQTNHSECFFLNICFDHSVLPATRACIKRFFFMNTNSLLVVIQILYSIESFEQIPYCNVLYCFVENTFFPREKKTDSSDLEIHITWSYDVECDTLSWTVIDIFSKPRHLLTARVITISFEPINTVLNCNELSNEWFYLRFSTFHV